MCLSRCLSLFLGFFKGWYLSLDFFCWYLLMCGVSRMSLDVWCLSDVSLSLSLVVFVIVKVGISRCCCFFFRLVSVDVWCLSDVSLLLSQTLSLACTSAGLF